MDYVAFVTLLLVTQYLYFMAMVGKARGDADITPPAVTGDETFERNLRVQLNTLEQLMVTLPAMWVCAHYFGTAFAGTMGLTFFAGRVVYRSAYLTDPTTRGKGMMIGFLANVALLIAALLGVLGELF
ncbi:MAG: MAPEG family protein [Gammaproteobacteria bacterium]|nr:MAG: MAPEG family protein [Gammaproteobacteria bacterium]RLA54029.1 MAG: MAPEG family protein [Gammaproteobacteria bacterium]